MTFNHSTTNFMNTKFTILALILFPIACLSPVLGDSKDVTKKADKDSAYSNPPVGSALRKQLLDTIRKPSEIHFGQNIVFKVNTLRATDTWAFFVGTAIQPNGKPVDYKKSKPYAENREGTQIGLDAGSLYGGVDVLLKKNGDQWEVVEISYDFGDVHWLDYDKRFGAPKKLISDPIK